MALAKWRKDLANFIAQFGLNFVGEIERQFFFQTLCASVFLGGQQSLAKSTPGLHTMRIVNARRVRYWKFYYLLFLTKETFQKSCLYLQTKNKQKMFLE